MYGFVDVQRWLLRKTFQTHFAPERSLAGVRSHVDVEVGFAWKRGRTLFALEWPFLDCKYRPSGWLLWLCCVCKWFVVKTQGEKHIFVFRLEYLGDIHTKRCFDSTLMCVCVQCVCLCMFLCICMCVRVLNLCPKQQYHFNPIYFTTQAYIWYVSYCIIVFEF